MAINSGAGPHFAFLNVNGSSFPLEHGSVSQQGKRDTSKFSGAIPLSYPGAEAALAGIGDNTAVVTVVTRGMQATLFTGEIDVTEFDYIGRIINVHGRDKSAPLHDSKTSEKWINKKPSDIVSDLIGRVGIAGNIFPSQLMAGKQIEQDYVKLSDNDTYAQIIHKMAEFDGARWWVDGNGQFNYQPTNSPQGTYTLNYSPASSGPISADFMSLRLSRNVQAGKGSNVTVRAWNPRKKQVFRSTSNVTGRGTPKAYEYTIPNLLQDHTAQHAKAQANERARQELTLSATVVGDPSINIAMGLQLNGTGFWDQVYEMDSIHHELGMSGHTTHITARAALGGA